MFIFSDVYDLHCNYLCTYNVIESFVYMLTLEFMGNLQCKVLGKTSYMGVYTSIFWFFTLWIFLGCFLMLIYLFCTCRKLLQFFVLARGEERWWMRELVFLTIFAMWSLNQEGGLFVQDETNRVGCLSDLFSDFTANKCVLCWLVRKFDCFRIEKQSNVK